MEKQTHRRQVILFPMPFQGHLTPMLQLGNTLHSRGFSITVIHTQINSPSTSNYPHFKFYSIHDGLSKSQFSTSDIVSLLVALNSTCLVSFKACLDKVLSECSSPPACLIVDSSWDFGQVASQGVDIPWMILHPSCIFTLLVYAAWPILLQKGYLPIKDPEMEMVLPDLPPLKVKDIPIMASVNPQDMDKMVFDFFNNRMKASSGLIFNSFQELEQDSITKFTRDFDIPSFLVGPLHKYFPASSSSLLELDQTCISWLDKQAPKSVLYVSFGSLAEVNETEFLEIAWGLTNANLPFLWVIRSGSVQGENWTEFLPEELLEMVSRKGHVVKWAPQQEVLAHPAIGGFWTHCGWNSILESVCEGVPMMCMPRFGDQHSNARYVSDVLRVGLHMEGRIERDVIEKMIKRLIVEIEGQEMRNRILHLKEKAELSLGKGGSSDEYQDKLINYITSL